MADALERRSAPCRMMVALAAAALTLACQPLDPAQPLPPSTGGTPCSREAAIASDTVVIAAGACNPWCIHVPAGSAVYFINHDPVIYFLISDPALPYDLQVPAYAGTVTLPLTQIGPVTWTAAHQPSATVTIFVE